MKTASTWPPLQVTAPAAKLMSSTSLTQISNHHRPSDQDSMRPFQDGRPRPSKIESQGLTVLQLNVEGLTTAKLSVLEHVATTNKATVVLLQETHKESDTILKLPGFTLAGYTKSKHHGLASFVISDVSWSHVAQSAEEAEVEWITTKVQDTTVVNVYKRLRTGVGRAKTTMRRWGYLDDAQSVDCDCGEPQTMAHLLSCRLLDEACTADDLATVTERAKACARKWENIV